MFKTSVYVKRELKNDLINRIKKLISMGYDVRVSGNVYLLLPEGEPIPEEADHLDIRVIRTTKEDIKTTIEFFRLLDTLGLEYDWQDISRRIFVKYKKEDEDKIIYLLQSPIYDRIMKSWSVNLYELFDDSVYIPINKPEYTHHIFMPKRDESYILVFKHFAIFSDGSFIYSIDLGRESKQFKISNIDYLLISHSHLDHIMPLIEEEATGKIDPYILTDMPTIDLLFSKRTDFKVRNDLDKLLNKTFVSEWALLGNIKVQTMMSGHDYGLNFYLENYADGYTVLYLSDSNLTSRAFKSKGVKFMRKKDVDILMLEYPSHTNIRTFVPEKGIIGTTSGEYEELLSRIGDKKILVDVTTTMMKYEEIRRRYKSYLRSRLKRVEVDYGTFKDFLENKEYDYFITTKGMAYKIASENKGMTVYVTNVYNVPYPNVRVISLKTHMSLKETLEVIKEVDPKYVVFHHYKENNNMNIKMTSEIEKIADIKRVIATSDENKPIKISIN